MPRQSSSDVTTRFVDRAEVLGALRRLARRLAQQTPAVEEVLLFGSFAEGNWSARSDADVLIILGDDPRPLPERMLHFAPYFWEAPVATEVFAYTRADIAAMTQNGNRFLERALRTGISLLVDDGSAKTSRGNPGGRNSP